MKSQLVPVCEGCAHRVEKLEDGFILVGSLHCASLDDDGSLTEEALAGGWTGELVNPGSDDAAETQQPQQTAWHTRCLMQALGLVKPEPKQDLSRVESNGTSNVSAKDGVTIVAINAGEDKGGSCA